MRFLWNCHLIKYDSYVLVGDLFMSVFIAVVSHGHENIIRELDCLSELALKYNVVVKMNLQEEHFIPYLQRNGISFIDDRYGLGFGENNNIIYSYCENEFGMKGDDIFIVFNPDVIAKLKDIEKVIDVIMGAKKPIVAVNLFKDECLSIPDNSVRHFPNLIQFVKSFLGLSNSTILDKELIHEPTPVDWAAGSFLAFKASHYRALKGFDEKYFMYCEDIDICYRSNKLGYPVTFIPNIKMQHLANHANRSIFSKHFYWHVKSVFRFLLTRLNITRPRSSLL